MKKLMYVLPIILVVIIILGVVNSPSHDINIQTDNLLRIHIRANSNQEIDQDVKYEIKDEFVNFLTPLVAECESKDEAIEIISQNASKLEHIADEVLKKHNFSYASKVKIKKEYFPTRKYENYVVESGVYDSVIVELGQAVGNNWWCVIYPPLCFTNFSTNPQNVVYKSKIMEIINKFFSKEQS